VDEMSKETFTYKNLKHVKLHGIEPYGEKTFDHPIEGGGIELIKSTGNKKKKNIEENLMEDDEI
jgi:hypothetical protein